MFEDDAIRKLRETIRMLETPGIREMLRTIEDRKKLLGGLDIATIKDAVEKSNRIKDITQTYGASQQMGKALFDAAYASRKYSDSIFGSEAMRQLAESEALGRRLVESVKPTVSGIEEFARRQAEQTARLSQLFKNSDWNNQLGAIAKALPEFNISDFHARFEPLGRMVEQAEASMRLVQWKKFAELDIQPSLIQSLELRTAQLNRSFAGLADRIILKPEIIIDAPPFMAKMPPLAVYSHAEGLRAISLAANEEQEEESPDVSVWNDAREETLTAIEDMLPRIKNDLVVSWKGGWHTAKTKSPDWARQSAASFRYVLTTVLDIVAPHNRVKKEVKPEYLNHKGEVIRRTQVAWLCEPLQNKTYRKVVFADLESAIAIIDAFSEAVHRSQYKDLESSFDRLAVRIAVALRHILELHFNISRN